MCVCMTNVLDVMPVQSTTALGCYAWATLVCASVTVAIKCIGKPAGTPWLDSVRVAWPAGPSEAGPSDAGPSGASAGGALAPGPAASTAAGAAAAAPLASYPPARATHEEVLADRDRFSATWREALAALGINLDKVSLAGLLFCCRTRS